jgi:hypothetical protein
MFFESDELRSTLRMIEAEHLDAYQGGTSPSPLARQSLASLPPPRENRAGFDSRAA